MAEAILSSSPIAENVSSSNTGSFELAWRYMTDNYTRLQIITIITALLHFVSYFTLCIPSFLFQFIPFMERFKIQKDKPVTFSMEWQCIKLLLVSQLLIQPPFYIGAHIYCEYMEIPFEWEGMPHWYVTLAQCFGCLVVDDAWHYCFHRLFHHRTIYKYFHKLHHNFPSPFGMVAEYVHPVETIMLGMGVMWGVLLFGNHLIFIWTWMLVRLIEIIDVHSGYDIPLNPLHLVPFYGGAKFHDFHHKHGTGNYAPTFTWCDWMFGTDVDYKEYLRNQEKEKQN